MWKSSPHPLSGKLSNRQRALCEVTISQHTDLWSLDPMSTPTIQISHLKLGNIATEEMGRLKESEESGILL